MKTKSISLTLVFMFSLVLFSCKTEVKKEAEKEKAYSIVPTTTKIGWTAYKTTEKVGVKGEFKEINVKEKSGATAKEALNGLEFSIPVSSLFTNNPDRDSKLKKFFFGVMDATELLSGTIKLSSDTDGSIELKMNGITNSIPVKYTISGQLVTFSGVMNVDNWNAQNAIASINKACFELHKGPDGVSKTWSEVAIEASTYLKVK